MAVAEHAQEIQTVIHAAQRSTKLGMTIAAAPLSGATETATLRLIQHKHIATNTVVAGHVTHVPLATQAVALKEPAQAAVRHSMITATTQLSSAT
jgi:hypothetical protein